MSKAQPERRGRNAPLEIHFYCASVPFNEDTIELKTSLGGSESAMVLLAKGLARRGHTVAVYTRFDVDDDADLTTLSMKCSDGVHYFPNDNGIVSNIVRAREPEVFVSLRHFPVMNWVDLNDIPLRVMWNEDLLHNAGDYYAQTWQVDLHAFVSHYHAEQYLRAIPDLRGMEWETRNPVDMDRIRAATAGVERDRKRMIHVSRPERAIVCGDGSPLLDTFAKMRETDPELRLVVCRYKSMYEGSPAVDAYCRRADELIDAAEGVSYLGELGKDDLYAEIAASGLMLYPGVSNFAETGCIAATEAQACGTPFVGTHIGALPETLYPKAGRLIRGDSSTPEYQEAFAGAALGLLSDASAYKACQDAGQWWANQYDMSGIAEDWETKLLGMFDARFKTRKDGVFQRLVMRDDLRAAKHMVAKHYDDDGARAELAEWEDTRNETPESYYENAVAPGLELVSDRRFAVMHYTLRNLFGGGDDPEAEWSTAPLRILNYAAGNGSLGALLLKTFPAAHVPDVDYSEQLVATAREFIAEFEDGAHVERYEARVGTLEDVETDAFDIVIGGEIAEHYEYPEEFLAALERCAKMPVKRLDIDDPAGNVEDIPGGLICITVPQGPFKEMMHRNSLDWSKEVRGHKYAFTKRDIEQMLAAKPEFDDIHMPLGETIRGSLVGHFFAHWRRDDTPIPVPDIERKIRRTRPRDTLSVCMIVKDSENDIARCLKSVDSIADEIWVADTGSSDATMEIARPYTLNGGDVWSIGTAPDAPAGAPPPGDFGWARNESVSRATGDWILWIDTDEAVEHPPVLARALTDNSFNGYAVRQYHVMKDAPNRFDKPIRLFRRVPRGKQAGMDYSCQGAIHEHFQPSLNDLIEPALALQGGDILHLGYINEKLRRVKCEKRNIPLLAYDREKNPDRVLGKLLVAREYCNYAKWEREATGMNTGDANPRVEQYRPHLEAGLKVIREEFFDPEGPYWEAAFEVYGDTLRLLGVGQEFLVSDIDPATGVMESRAIMFACPEDHAVYVRDVLRRVAEYGKRPEITWDDAAA